MTLFSELQRRDVWKTLALYIVGAWVLVQVADLLFPGWCIPEFAIRHVWIAALLGLPIALVVSWQFDISKAGLRRTISTSGNDSRALAGSDYALLTTLSVLSVAIIVVQGQSVMATRDCGLGGPFNPPDNSIAVLPFVSLGADEDDAWLGTGFADAVLTNLANLPGVMVTSRSSSFEPRLKGKSIREVAMLLGVAFVIEGSVQRQGDRLRIVPRIVDARNDSYYWSPKIDRDYSDLFAIQDEVAEAAASAVEVVMSPDIKQRIDREGTDNLAALEAYSKAMENLRVLTIDSTFQAIEQLKQAIEIDPDYARAHAAVGHVYLDGRYASWSELTRDERRGLARDAANTALRIAPGMSTALTVLARVTDDFDASTQLIREAVANDPNDTIALQFYADVLDSEHKYDEAIDLLDKLTRLDPLNETHYTELAGRQQGRLLAHESLATLARGKEKIPDSVILRDYEWWSYKLLHDFSSMIRVKHETLAIDPKDYQNRMLIAEGYFRVGMPDEAVRWYERAAETAPEERYREIYRLRVRTNLGVYYQRDDEEVFESLQRRWNERDFQEPADMLLFVEYGDRVGRLDEVLKEFEEWYAELFTESPDLARIFQDWSLDRTGSQALSVAFQIENIASIVGEALLRAGDRQRGETLLRRALEWHYTLADGEWNGSHSHTPIRTLLWLGETEAALDAFRGSLNSPGRLRLGELKTRFLMQNHPAFAPIRATPEYAALIEELDRLAAEHRGKLQAMDLPMM